MNELMAARSITTRPVVTLGGDAVAHVKDTVCDAAASRITGFTLTGRGLLSGPLKDGLPWAAVSSLGHDAVMIRDRRGLVNAAAMTARQQPLRARLLGARVLTEAGAEVGTVLDVVVEGGTAGRVVGFRVAASRRFVPGPARHRRRVYVPRGGTLSVTGRALVLPEDAVRHIADDLPGFSSLVGGVPGPWRGSLP
ncbi:PRC-barrel domain-containing protein [Streptomyces sp. NBC_01723]|uniref:PRC-barrel domain-containing protein n=1 Tax=unclassified Streptomyces TaxID=2593676 RepID=UPI00278B2F2C|nr:MULTISPECIES: PRC-barrel domain-containing protein [unclassified Streptomyces]MDQ0402053.1 sporulation protein YlmC with PRC-barrel domain [Streptomyces sp. DSM 40167]